MRALIPSMLSSFQENGRGIGRIRLRQIPDASAESLHPFILDSVTAGSVIHTDGWRGYRRHRDQRLPPTDNRVEGQEGACLRTAPPSASRYLTPETVAYGNSSGRSQPQAPRVLPRRVHVSIQPPKVSQSWEIVLSPDPASGSRRTLHLRRNSRPGPPQPKTTSLQGLVVT